MTGRPRQAGGSLRADRLGHLPRHLLPDRLLDRGAQPRAPGEDGNGDGKGGNDREAGDQLPPPHPGGT